ncbi:MAG: hypothetical protein D6775_15755 [Caldilineae bacterium]|nr:MAG: hypothetical protein D6775_15755 [Caldilineae bacterium]
MKKPPCARVTGARAVSFQGENRVAEELLAHNQFSFIYQGFNLGMLQDIGTKTQLPSLVQAEFT